jgi:hypothetical protein
MLTFNSVIVPLSVALGLSLMVERVLEIIKNFFESYIREPKTTAAPTLSAVEKAVDSTLAQDASQRQRSDDEAEVRKLRGALDKTTSVAEKKELQEKLAALERQGEWDERVPASSLLAVEPAQPPNMVRVLREFVLQLLGLATGIVLADVFELRLFHAFLGNDAALSDAVDYILTGILIGGGSAPIHLLIQFISERRVSPTAASLDAKEAPAAAPAAFVPVSATPVAPAVDPLAGADWTEIAYDGGVDRALLERVHIRPRDPDMIVIHHTAMSSRSTFEDVVRTIKDRTDGKGNHWVTGYNCVILADGAIRPFCRWDRFGNHAAGYNEQSLGLAFNGNFEPDPKVPFSNPDGRYGATRPTDAQLRAGARVVALWTFLYDGIKLDFERNIIPHRKISSKTCPGSAFPYQEFEKLVKQYVELWQKSAAVQQSLAAYKDKPYLYV